jgi:alpha-2-macroglobulin
MQTTSLATPEHTMRRHAFLLGLTCTFALVAAVLVIPVVTVAQPPQLEGNKATLEQGKTLAKQGNFADAAARFRAVIANRTSNKQWVVDSLEALEDCRNRLQKQNELDDDLQIALDNHASSHEVLTTVADQFSRAEHFGVVANQKFTRGYSRGYAGRGGIAGTTVIVQQKDRIRELRLRRAAIAAAEQARFRPNNVDYCRLHMKLAETILRARSGNQAWALQTLTDLDVTLDYTAIDGDPPMPSQNAPVDETGEPLYYSIPESWETANSDGERLRWTLEQAKKNRAVRWEAIATWAGFTQTQFSVATLQQDMWIFRSVDSTKHGDADSGVFSIHTLKEDETIAKLATGVKRFTMPEEHNFIALYESIRDNANNLAFAEQASWDLVNVFLNRRQYPRAAELLAKHIQRFPEGGSPKWKQLLLDDILQPRMQFDPVPSQLAGEPAKLSLLFRNADEIRFTAHKVDLEKILADTKTYCRDYAANRSRPFGGDKSISLPDLNAPVNLFVKKELDKYLLGKAAEWKETVQPRENHWDRRIEVETPLKQAGLYVVDAIVGKDDAGQKSQTVRCMVWIQDAFLVRKPLANQYLFQFVDAATGEGIAGANLECFGFQRARNAGQNGPRQPAFKNFAVNTDQQGFAKTELLDSPWNWVTVARTKSGKIAVLGLDRLWRSNDQFPAYEPQKAYGVSDRPVYRPGETLKAKFWLARPTYGDAAPIPIANQNVSIGMIDPAGNQVMEKNLVTDAYGGCDFEFELPASATLGSYSFQVKSQLGLDSPWFESSLRFRVEEYRKPEFEVNILSPSTPVALGETFEAVVQAKYYFGAPVTDASVTVRVQRSSYRESYYPVAPYDWCYEPGYWWFNQDYTWYPGFRNWCGCFAPTPYWMRNSWPGRWGMDPPELVLEQQLQLDSSGEAKVAIDTALAKQIYGDEDHRYTITTEVRDASRRTITAEGSVIAAREAFKIYSWTERGFYRVGDRMVANFQARMLDGTPTQAKGTLDLLKIQYDADAKPIERVVETLEVATDAEGNLTQIFSADRAGQYRLRLRLTDDQGHRVEGGYIVTVRGDGVTGDDFRYNALELIPDRASYQPGDTVRLQISANRDDARVALFIRPVAGVYTEPRMIQLTAKSSVVEIPVVATDQPNFFVEAYTVYDGKLHQQVKQIIVPPKDRVLDVKLTSDKKAYLPGEEAKVELTVRDPDGNPVAGSCLLAVYDRSLEQIAGDVLPTDVREFFWKWQRGHNVNSTSNASNRGYPIAIPNEVPWRFLGIFGSTLADDADAMQGGDDNAMLGAFDGAEEMMMADAPMEAAGFGGMGGMGGGMGGSMGMGGMGEGMTMQNERAMMAAASRAPGSGAGMESAADAGGQPPAVRKDFADSACWVANIETDAAGKATVTFKMPENLTSWKFRSWAISEQLQVGSSAIEAETRKPLLVRLQTPRFLVERDEIVISSLVNNDTRQATNVSVALEIDGETQMEFAANVQPIQTVMVEAGGQARVDWRMIARAEGKVTLRTIARSDIGSDAMQLEVPILVNGILKTESFAGTVRSGVNSSTAKINIPVERRVEQSKLTVRLSPSLAASMIDALPYLASYPYGCTEQTLNRFLPTVLTQRVLEEMQIDLAKLADKRRANLNAQEIGSPTDRKAQWQKFDREAVFDKALVDDMVASGVQRLTDMQMADGGWGWFSGVREYSSPHTTATVVRGLLVARENGVAIVPDVTDRGVAWLLQQQAARLQALKDSETNEREPIKTSVNDTDALVFHVLTLAGTDDASMNEMLGFLFEKRQSLSVYGKALVAWATLKRGDVEKTDMLRQNMEQFLIQDAENETAFLDNRASWWYWYGSEIEANAIYLKLLAAQDPNGVTAPRVVKYLLNNRKHATYWKSTRDTALVIEAFADYLRATGELATEMKAEVFLAGKRLGQVEFTAENLFEVNNTIEISGSAVPAGEQTLEIRRTGPGNLYWNAYSTNFTLEEEITPAGSEVKIERRYYRVDPKQGELLLPGKRGAAVDAKRAIGERIPLEDLDELESGSLVEVELLVQSKNDYEYLIIEDRKAASLETVENQSGYFYSAGLSIYRELRDQHVALCIRRLPKGNYSIRYQMRSEAPGVYTALPATISGMYAPELVGNSADFDLQVVDR